jgi:hypothetical protein
MGIMEMITWAAEDVSCPIKIELLLKWYHNLKVPGISVIIAYWCFDTGLVGIVAEMLSYRNALSLKGKKDLMIELRGDRAKKMSKIKAKPQVRAV